MKTTLSKELMRAISQNLETAFAEFAARFPPETGSRQPVHVVYGGAHLFKSNTARRLGDLAIRALETYAPDAETFAGILDLPAGFAAKVYDLTREKLLIEPVEDFRIDFEDGYGVRPETEEDEHAVFAAKELAKAFEAKTISPFTGIRVKAFTEESHLRSIRTLDLFLTTLVEETNGRLPENFVVTLPKIVSPAQVAALADVLDTLENELDLPEDSLKIELMIETTQAIFDERGESTMPLLLEASRGRCSAAHFGAYDFTASCGITAAYQDLLHPLCDFARNMMQISFGGAGVRLSDGATNVLPVAPNRSENLTDEQKAENQAVVERAWRIHYEHVRHSLANGFYQSWDLHPAQLPTRYAAVYTFFLEGLNDASERLRNFIEQSAKATLVADVFDDAATGQGLLNYFLRAINCKALTEREVLDITGLTLFELRSGSFAKILRNRKK
jgi:citrate lyase beta subunit